jgi:hypothetical protein
MVNAFRYVFDDNLYNGYSQPLPLENGKKVYRIFFPEQTGQYGDFFDVIETGEHTSPYRPRISKTFDQFYKTVIDWFSDYKLLSE